MSRFNYKGFSYEPYEEVEADGDNVKIWHDVRLPDGITIASLDWTPYSYLTLEQFQLFVDAGLPDRFAVRNCGGTITEEELHQIKISKIGEEVRQNLLKGARS